MIKDLKDIDPEISELILQEYKRQEQGLELIASENYTSEAVMKAQGSILTNKYAEGLPQKRYYGGCEFIDKIENLAIERACKLFKAKFANVQPHSGSQANMAAYFSLLDRGDKIMGMNLSEGGHLTHGSSVNFSGRFFEIVFYGVDKTSECINYDEVLKIAKEQRPKLIIAGASAYSRVVDFKKFREIADVVNAYLMVDMAHIAGLVATNFHPSPIDYADIVTTTTHKTLRGPRGGLILTNNEELAKKVNFNVFPGIQGGPLEHVIAAKAVSFQEALSDNFIMYQKRTVENAKELANSLKNLGLKLVADGTDNHLLMVKTDSMNITGKKAEQVLDSVAITCNKNMIPGDTRSPFVTSGIRLGTPAITTRGLTKKHMGTLAKWIYDALSNYQDEDKLKGIKSEVLKLCKDYPVYP